MYHARFGGSNAKRWKNCTGYLGLAATLPRPPGNQAAREGTAQHTCMETMLRDPDRAPDDFLGAVVDGVEIVQAHVDAMNVALNDVTELLAEFPEDATIRSERFYTFLQGDGMEAQPEVGGSCDLTIIGGTRAAFVDFKFGQHEVGADSDQNRFYMAAAARTLSAAVEHIEIWDSVIVQPAFDPSMTRERYRRPEINRFRTEFLAAYYANKSRPEFREGDWCQWCPAMVACPLKTQRLASLSQRPETVARMAEWYAAYRALETPAGLIRAQLTHELENGVTVPGYKLVERRTESQWRDASLAYLRLAAAGIPTTALMVMRPPAEFRDRAPELVDELSRHPPGGNTIAPNSDTRPAVPAAGALAAALRHLGG